MEKKKDPILRDLLEELHGERVLLRPYRAGDGRALWEAVEESREQLQPWRPYENSPVAPDEDETEAYVRHEMVKWILREYLSMSLWEKETGRYLGGVGLYRIRWEVPSFQIGYWLRASAEGKGYMTEAVRVLCDCAFRTLEAQRVEIRCDRRNVRSAGIPRRLGFMHDTTLENQSRNAHGELLDDFVFFMTPYRYTPTYYVQPE
jgi:RimJ/RimL family protein N-acetyltransferase